MQKEHNKPAESEETASDSGTPEAGAEQDIDQLTTLHERTIAMLSYIGFLAIVPFYLKKDSKFCRFHGKQGMILAILFYFCKLFMVLDFFSDMILFMQFLVFAYMGLAALSGKWKKAPWIYEWSCQIEKQLTLKTKEEEEEDARLKPDQVKTEVGEENQ